MLIEIFKLKSPRDSDVLFLFLLMGNTLFQPIFCGYIFVTVYMSVDPKVF